jgi:23S rRNA pseudouridine2605 synthase
VVKYDGYMDERLQKIIAAAGIASRRKAEELITQGRVAVNGTVVSELGAKADAARDHIRVDGKLLQGAEQKTYIMLNKPKGFVTTVSDPEGRQTVMDLLKGHRERLYPVGRLDYGSEGLLLMTNDGDLANRLTKASAHVPKTYEVKVSGRVPAEAIAKLRAGVYLPQEPGKAAKAVKTAPCEIRLLREAENPWYEITLVEGRNRQIRRMFEQVGHHVEKIKRVRFGPLVLNVETGEYRELARKEVALLKSPTASVMSPRRPARPEKRFSVKRAERQHAAFQRNKVVHTKDTKVPQRTSPGTEVGGQKIPHVETRHAASQARETLAGRRSSRAGASESRDLHSPFRKRPLRGKGAQDGAGERHPKKFGEKKFGSRKFADKNSGERKYGEKPAFAGKKSGGKKFGGGKSAGKKFAFGKFAKKRFGGKKSFGNA